MISSVVVNRLGDMVSPCRTPFLMLILLLSLCHRAVGVDFLEEFDVHIFYPLLLKRGQYCLGLHLFEGFSLWTNAMLSGILYCLHFSFSWFTTLDVACRRVSASESSLLLWLVFVECLL